MEDVMNVAAYITNRYLVEYNQPIDEMKLHKLMYFAQENHLFRQTNLFLMLHFMVGNMVLS